MQGLFRCRENYTEVSALPPLSLDYYYQTISYRMLNVRRRTKACHKSPGASPGKIERSKWESFARAHYPRAFTNMQESGGQDDELSAGGAACYIASWY